MSTTCIDVTDSQPYSFLTETHRKVLSDDWEGSESTLRSHKSEIRKRSKGAIADLIEVAESHEIDNESKIGNERLFEPEEIRVLLTAIVRARGLMTEEYEHVSEEFRNELYFEVNRFLLGFQPEDAPTAEPPEEPPQDDTDGVRVTCHSCGYEWLYTGSAESKATCPSCSNKTNISR